MSAIRGETGEPSIGTPGANKGCSADVEAVGEETGDVHIVVLVDRYGSSVVEAAATGAPRPSVISVGVQ
jgi:hypothetical protein